MARLISAIFVSQLIRRVSGEGGFAAVLKKGATEAGAVYIAVRERSGDLAFYAPASQHSYGTEGAGERSFMRMDGIKTDADVTQFTEKEARFDPDFWLVELEPAPGRTELPFDLMTL